MNRFYSILFFVVVWITCQAQVHTVFIIDSLGSNVGHITFKPDIQDGFLFYHLEHLDQFKGYFYVADEEFSGFIDSYLKIRNGEMFFIASIRWIYPRNNIFLPTLFRAKYPDSKVPERYKYKK